ncbi:xaa-Pro aminopeptidase 2 isoform X2 [Stigmatopora nigra]
MSSLLALLLVALTVNVHSVDLLDATERNCSLSPPYLPSTAVNSSLQLKELREQMLSSNLSAYIIPGTDAHLSEYISPRDARLAFMTGFTGSAGTAVVTPSKAALWTDSRYWVQAERQMDCNWDLQKDVYISSIAEWLISEVPQGGQIGFDPFLFSLKTQEDYKMSLESSNRSLKSMPGNLVDRVWKDRPAISPESLIRLPDRVIQRSWQVKVNEIRNQMKDNPYQPTALLLSALDETAWLFNMRGNDIPFNPFFYSYTLLTMDEIWLFLHKERVTEELEMYLNASCAGPFCVQLKSYNVMLDELKEYVNNRPGIKVWIGIEYTNYALFEVIKSEDKFTTSSYSPVMTTKAVKDDTEQRILRDAHVRDAVAVIQLLMWLEKVVPEGNETELSASAYVNHCRSKQNDNKGPSFETISASGPNAALAHYSPTAETNRKLTVDEMYLVDSGGQYLDGTTDITRTVHWGTPTALQKEAFTRVLIGNIEISRTIFPSGTKGPVGFQSNNIPFREGMFTSIEPGYYKESDFGIRIEDIAVVVPSQTKYGHNYLTFDTVSMVPYDRKLIDTSLLSPVQLQWLNKYYETIRKLMGPELDRQGLQEEKIWMLKHTEPFVDSRSSSSVSPSSLTLAIFVTLYSFAL